MCDTPKLWGRVLGSLSGKDIARGFDRCIERGAEWPPSLAEFHRLCLPSAEELGLPDIDKAYNDAIRKRWLHPIVYRTVEQIGVHEFRLMGDDAARKLFRRVYGDLLMRAAKGEAFTMPEQKHMAIEYKPIDTSDWPKGKDANIAKMREILNMDRGEDK